MRRIILVATGSAINNIYIAMIMYLTYNFQIKPVLSYVNLIMIRKLRNVMNLNSVKGEILQYKAKENLRDQQGLMNIISRSTE